MKNRPSEKEQLAIVVKNLLPVCTIYDLPKCFMMTWEELMDRTSTTTVRYDIWNEEVLETKNYSTSTNGGRHFKPQSSYLTPINERRHFKS